MQLLLGAIRSLPEQDQDAVLALLLQGLTDSSTWEKALHRSDQQRRVLVALHGNVEFRAGGLSGRYGDLMPDSAAKVVPIRFPAQIHEQLKAWCEEHNFPMAAVVRGLVERFLDSQEMP